MFNKGQYWHPDCDALYNRPTPPPPPPKTSTPLLQHQPPPPEIDIESLLEPLLQEKPSRPIESYHVDTGHNLPPIRPDCDGCQGPIVDVSNYSLVRLDIARNEIIVFCLARWLEYFSFCLLILSVVFLFSLALNLFFYLCVFHDCVCFSFFWLKFLFIQTFFRIIMYQHWVKIFIQIVFNVPNA